MARPKRSQQKLTAGTVPAVPSTDALSFNLKQAAAITGIALWHLRSAIWHGHLSAHLAGKKQIILRTDLERWLASQPVVRRRRAA